MSSNIETRIERLERLEAGEKDAADLCLLVSFHAPGGAAQSEAHQITDGAGQRWTRNDGESEASFLGRAKAEACKARPLCMKVLVSASGATAGEEHR